jgi:16S rRNA (uracil1498-N3)-methyltransferase
VEPWNYNPPVHRFFAPNLDPGDEAVTLPHDESEHLTRVLRLGAGDMVSVFDGRGHEFMARVVVHADRRAARVQVVSRVDSAAEPGVSLTLAQAVLKGEKMDDIVRDAVMLGVSAVQPLVTTRAETTVAALARGARPDRWRRVALASVKQSGRAVLPESGGRSRSSRPGRPRARPHADARRPGAHAEVEPPPPPRPAVPQDAAILSGQRAGGWRLRRRASPGRARELGGRTLGADAKPVAAISAAVFVGRFVGFTVHGSRFRVPVRGTQTLNLEPLTLIF